LLFAKLEHGDIVIAAKLDRLFRSALDALKVVESLNKRGVKLHLLDLGGDISGNGLSPPPSLRLLTQVEMTVRSARTHAPALRASQSDQIDHLSPELRRISLPLTRIANKRKPYVGRIAPFGERTLRNTKTALRGRPGVPASRGYIWRQHPDTP
jgi:hypothetical protein